MNYFNLIKPLILIFLVSYFGPGTTIAQSVSFKKCQYINEINGMATPETNLGNDFIYTQDGGYLVTGNILLGGLNQEPITKKFDGSIQFSKTHGETNRNEIATSVLEYNSHYYVVGHSAEEFTKTNVFISKFTFNGYLVWTKSYNSFHDDFAMKVIRASGNNNHLIVVGYTNSHFAQPSLNDYEIMAFRVNSQTGALINGVHTYGVPYLNDRGYDITPAVEGSGYVILGTREHTNFSTQLLEVDATLELTGPTPLIINDKLQDYHATSIVKSGNKYFMAGYYNAGNERDGLLMRVNQDFTALACRKYDLNQINDEFTDLELDATGNLYTVGKSGPVLGGLKSGRLMKFTPSLGNVWHKKTTSSFYRDDQAFYGLDIDGSSIGMVGSVITTNSFPEKHNILIIEANINGYSCCLQNQQRLRPTVIKPETSGPILQDKIQHQIKTNRHYNSLGKAKKICDNSAIPLQAEEGSSLRIPTQQSTQIAVYPNPNTGSFTVELEPSTIKELILLSVTGKTVYQFNDITQNRTTVTLEDLSAGIYLLKATDHNGSLTVNRIVITDQ